MNIHRVVTSCEERRQTMLAHFSERIPITAALWEGGGGAFSQWTHYNRK